MVEYRETYAEFGRKVRIYYDPVYNRISVCLKRFAPAIAAAEIAVVREDNMVKQKIPLTYDI
jgi:hypothetical protein